jgi:hypothetical protein
MNPTFFFAEVVSVHDDEEMIGRAKIRILGDQDDRARLPNEELRWARPIMNSYDAPQYAGVGRGGTGLVPGSRVFGFFMDADNQHPFILGTIPTAGRTNSPPSEQGNMPDGSPVAAGNPFGGDGPLSFHRQRNRLVGDALSRVEQLAPAAQRLASDSIEAFFSAGAGNGPPRYGRETNILASIAPGGIAADMTALVRRINPNNIGGMPGTLMSLSSLAGRLTGIPTQILGSGAFSAMNMVSSILNINTSNILGSIQNIVGGASELLTLSGAGQLASTVQQVGQTATALAQMSPTQLITGAISTLPLSPIQQFALNMSVGAIASGNPAQLLNVATTIGETLVPGATTAINDLGQIAGSITQIASLATNTPFSLASLVQASELTNRISALASNNSILSGIFDISQATDAQRDAFEQIRALAYDAGHVLNVGDRLVNLANNPSLLLSELDRIINNTV